MSIYALLIMIVMIVAVALVIFIFFYRYRKRYTQSIIEDFGFDYDPEQDIFYSDMNAWQRKFGYCQLYDEAAAPLSMIMDCEPVRFEYGGRKWLIELWKGQYGMLTGAEIGVYSTAAGGLDLDIPGIFDLTLYENTDDENHLQIRYILKKNGKPLFVRNDRHWWLTGFVLGEFSEPWDLTMSIEIVLKDEGMCGEFVNALKKLGYTKEDLYVEQNTVCIWYRRAYSSQPATRTEVTDAIIQRKNQLVCEAYQEIAGVFNNSAEKLEYIQKNEKKLYKYMLKTGRTKKLYTGFRKKTVRSRTKK